MLSAGMRNLKSFGRRLGAALLGRKARIHRIPFGPIRGKSICMSFDISPRMFFGIDEPWIARLARTYLRPRDVVYDIGAHIGYTTLLFSHCLKGEGVVHAFEVLPTVAEDLLRKTVEANHLKNVVIHPIGLAAREQRLRLPIGETTMTSIYSHAEERSKADLCRLVSLDAYQSRMNLPEPSLMKIDIERAEVDCLMGGMGLIRRCLPIMIIEFHSKELLKRGYALLKPLGYEVMTRSRVVDDRLIMMLGRFHQSVLCLPGQRGSSGQRAAESSLADA